MAKKKKKTKSYHVYIIEHNGDIIYYGRTNDLKRRQYQHNYNLRKDKENLLYTYLKENKVPEIVLKSIYEYKTKIESKRMEMFLILNHYFNEDEFTLKQKIPNISDR